MKRYDLRIPLGDYSLHIQFMKKRIIIRLYDEIGEDYESGYMTIKDPEQLKTKIKRDVFGKKIWEILEKDEDILLHIIDLINGELEKRRGKKQPKKYVKAVEVTEATAPDVDIDGILQDPYLIHKILDVIRKYPLVNEDINGLTTFLIIFSGQTKYPISAIIEGLSSTGKNTILNAARQLIPREWIQYFTTSTPEAIKYLDPEFEGTLLIYEAAGITSQTGALGLRSIGEGESIKTIMPIRDESGRMVLYEHETKARNFITTTTNVDIEKELATRIFTLSTDDSPDTTRKVIETELDYAWTPKSLREKLYDEKPLIDPNMIKEVLRRVDWRKYEVIACLPPFLEKMTLLTPRLRRDIKKLINLIRILAILNHRKRTIIRIEDNYYVIAGLEDIYIATRIGNEIFKSTFTGLTRRLQECFEMCIQTNLDQFTVKDVQQQYQKNNKKVGYTTVYRYLEQLTDLGYLYKDSSGRQNQYQVARTDISDIRIDLDPGFVEYYNKKVEERMKEFEALKNLHGRDVEFIQINLDETIVDPFTGKIVPLEGKENDEIVLDEGKDDETEK